mgnify:CR=1 FL=1
MASEARERGQESRGERVQGQHGAERNLVTKDRARSRPGGSPEGIRSKARAVSAAGDRADPPPRQRHVHLVDEQVRPAFRRATLGAQRFQGLEPRQHVDDVRLRAGRSLAASCAARSRMGPRNPAKTAKLGQTQENDERAQAPIDHEQDDQIETTSAPSSRLDNDTEVKAVRRARLLS